MADFVECQVLLPLGTQVGAKLMIQIDSSGRKFQITVPPGARGGQTIRVRVPRAPASIPNAIQPRNQHEQSSQTGQPKKPLWHGWFLKQQPHFPHNWQRRYGTVSPRSSNPNSFELIYYSSDTEMRSGNRRGSLPLGWSENPSGHMGRICLDGPPSRDGKLQFILRTPHRDFNLTFGPSLSSAAEFYFCYRVISCGDNSEIAKEAIFGSNEKDPNMTMFRLQNLHTEQCRIEALGMDKFEAAASLVHSGGDGDTALSNMISTSARKNGIPVPTQNPPPQPSTPDIAGHQTARSDLESMGFSKEDAALAVEKHGTDTEAAMMWLVERRETPNQIQGERYELSFGDGPLGVKVTTGNVETGDFPVVKPSPGGSNHIANANNAHLPQPGHLCEAYSTQGGPWVELTGTMDQKYDDCIHAAMGPRPLSLRLIAVDGVGESKASPSFPPPQYNTVATAWEYERAGSWYAYPIEVQSRLNAAAESGISCVAGIELNGGVYNLFIDSMTQFNNSTNEFTPMRRPPSQGPQEASVPSLDELSLQQHWHASRNATPEEVSAPPLLDLPDESPVLVAQQSDEGEDGMALFATLLSGESEVLNDAERAECSVCFEDLCAEPVALFFDASGGRVCQHFFHHQCACELPKKCCPLCNREFDEVKELPDALDAPKQWFSMVDHGGNGTLDRRDVVEALKAQLPVKTDRLEAHFDDLWKRWDTDESGDLSLDELFNPKDGLLEYLRMAHNRTDSFSGPPTLAPAEDQGDFFSVTGLTDIANSGLPQQPDSAAKPPPKLTMTTREDWFRHFDASKTGHLDTTELLVAINLCGGNVDIDTVSILLMTCELRSEGKVFEDEFLRSGGVAELLIASLGYS